MKSEKLSVAFCLREIADNIEKYNCYGMRIGISKLSFCGNEYEVTNWRSVTTRYSDLMEAICAFIEVNK